MDGLLRTKVHVHDFTRKHVPFNAVVRWVGQKIDDIVMETTPDIRYILKIILRLPLLFAIHYWLLLAPCSDGGILEVPMMAIKLFVTYSLARSWIFNTETLFLYYTSVYSELFIALIQESLYWMFQNEAHSVCHETRVITFGDIDDIWWTPALVSVVIESLYFWSHVFPYYKVQPSFEQEKCCLVYVAYLTPLICSVTGIFPHFMSTVWYFVNKSRLLFAIMIITYEMEDEDRAVDTQKLKAEVVKCKDLQGEDKSKSNRRINFFLHREKLDRNKAHVMVNFPSKKSARDALLIFGILYFTLVLILEMYWYKTESSNIESMYCLIIILYNWSTTLVMFMVFMSFTAFATTCVTAVGVWFSTWEISIGTAMDIDQGRIAQYSLLTLLVETGIPTTNISLDIEGLSLVAFILIFLILHQTYAICEHQILEIANRGSKLSVLFYFRVLILVILLVIAPVIMSFGVAYKFDIDQWDLFFCLGGLIFVSDLFLFLAEWLLVSLTLYTEQYLTVLESCIQYIHIIKQLSYILLLPFQFYSRYYMRSFRAWWLLRAGNLIFNYFTLLIVFYSKYKDMYAKRQKLLNILSSLSDVSYNNEQTDCNCSICFATIVEGKELPCLHTFHVECLRRWFQVRTVCPTCNLDIK